MAFEPEPNEVQTELGDMSYQIFDPRPGSEETRAVSFSAQILDQDGDVMRVRTGDMIQHMLPEEIQTVVDLVTAWRARAAALIPTA